MLKARVLFPILALFVAASAAAQGTAPAGTEIIITLDQAISSKDATVGQVVDGSVSENLVVNGKTVLPKAAKVKLSVTTVEASGRLKGQAKLWLKIDSVEMNAKSYPVDSEVSGQDGPAHTKRNVVAIGGGTAAGAVIGAIAGGGKGAAIGAAVGAAAGTGAAAATGKKDVEYPAETQLRFALKSALVIPSSGAAKGLRKGQKRSN